MLRKGLKKSQKILDYMNRTELAINLFRATQTEEKLKRDATQGKKFRIKHIMKLVGALEKLLKNSVVQYLNRYLHKKIVSNS